MKEKKEVMELPYGEISCTIYCLMVNPCKVLILQFRMSKFPILCVVFRPIM
jgi:hypothetical protein